MGFSPGGFIPGGFSSGGFSPGDFSAWGLSESCRKMRSSGTESVTADGRQIEAIEIARDRVPGAVRVELRWGALAPHRASSIYIYMYACNGGT